jgi:cobyrinic acid a,c-diamide synthase
MAAAVLIAAPASGQGKTTAAAALARLHARRGGRVRCFKCGPDFLDPFWLAAASGQEVDSLDLWINGAADCARRLALAAREADLVVVEGVMGLFDGAPSAADLACRFGIPVLAIVDASAMAGTFGAIVHGLRSWRPGLPWAGVLANRVAGDAHAAMLQSAVADDASWQGFLPRDPRMTLGERHLGLRLPAEDADAGARLDAAADALARTRLGQRSLDDWPTWQPPVFEPLEPAPRHLAGRVIAIARDAAFAFIYPANVEVLRQLGADLRFFSPLAGDPLPACDALWLPGGYPELHAARLSTNTALREQIAAHVRAGRPLWAECGGMMALADTLVDAEGARHAMWGLFPGTVVVGKCLQALGSQQLAIGNQVLRGHTFHWSRLETRLDASAHTQSLRGGATERGEAVFELGSLRASWFHPWFASSPVLTARLFGDRPLLEH